MLALSAPPGIDAADREPGQTVVRADGRTLALPALAGALTGADVLVMFERAGAAAVRRVQVAILQALGDRKREVLLVVEGLPRSAQEPLDHFLMGHLSERELAADGQIAAGTVADYKPLLDAALQRAWPALAAGPAADDPRTARETSLADVAATANAVAGAGATRPLIVVVPHGVLTTAAGQLLTERLAARLAGRRVLSVAIGAATGAADPADYVVSSSVD